MLLGEVSSITSQLSGIEAIVNEAVPKLTADIGAAESVVIGVTDYIEGIVTPYAEILAVRVKRENFVYCPTDSPSFRISVVQEAEQIIASITASESLIADAAVSAAVSALS